MKTKLYILSGIFTSIYFCLALKLVYVQIINNPYQSSNTDETVDNYKNTVSNEQSRGSILDKKGKVLAFDKFCYDIKLDKYHIENKKLATISMALFTKSKRRQISNKFSDKVIIDRLKQKILNIFAAKKILTEKIRKNIFNPKKKLLIINSRLQYNVYKELKEELNKYKIRGVTFIKKKQRIYPYKNLFAHIIGYVDFKNVGQIGIERFYNKYLNESKYFQEIKDQKSNKKKKVESFYKSSKVTLTIDANLQLIIQKELDRAFKFYKPDKLIAIFVNPKTGEIIGLSNLPDYNPNTRKGNRKNYAISMLYDPGSVFKIVTAGAAFDNPKIDIDPYRKIHCHLGKFKIGNVVLTDSHPYYSLTPIEIIQKSSNIGIYKMALELGKKNIYTYAKLFGFGEKTNIDLSAESSGNIKKPVLWNEYSHSRIPIGYEVQVTPIQMVMAMGVIANNGYLMQPYICKKIVDRNGKTVLENKPKVIRQVLNIKSVEVLKDALVRVVGNQGTAPKAQIEGIQVAGKTGTSRKYREKIGGYYKKKYIVSFSGFLPANDPKILGLIVVDNPKTTKVDHYGGQIAAPIFKNIVSKIIKKIEVDEALITHQY